MIDQKLNGENSNYENTVFRIVNEGLRFSKEISPELYTFYKEWIENKKPDKRTAVDKKYLALYKTLPKSKRSTKAEERCPYDSEG